MADSRLKEGERHRSKQLHKECGCKVLLALLGKLLRNRADPQRPPTNIYTDSQLVVGQLMQGFGVKANSLMVLHNEAALGLRKTEAKLIWVPRHQIVEKVGH